MVCDVLQLRANQEDTADDFAAKVKEGSLDSDLIRQRYSPHLLSKDQARTNVVNEIMNAEREYVKHLKDVMEVSLTISPPPVGSQRRSCLNVAISYR